jgi:hypothetical protein
MKRGLAASRPVSAAADNLGGERAALVLVAVETRGKRSGRVRMKVIPDFKPGFCWTSSYSTTKARP